MDLKTEEIIKILLILGVLYLLFKCVLTENFTDQPIVKDSGALSGNLYVTSDSKIYYIVSLLQLKDEYRKVLINDLVKSDNELKNLHKDKINFLDSEPEIKKGLTDNNLSSSAISKMPLIIILKDNLEKYATGKFEMSIKNDSERSITPKGDDGKNLHLSEFHKILFYSQYDNTFNTQSFGKEIKGISSSSKVIMEPIKINDKDAKLLTEKTIIIPKTDNSEEKPFTFYTISTDTGKEFKWEFEVK